MQQAIDKRKRLDFVQALPIVYCLLILFRHYYLYRFLNFFSTDLDLVGAGC